MVIGENNSAPLVSFPTLVLFVVLSCLSKIGDASLYTHVQFDKVKLKSEGKLSYLGLLIN